MSNFKVGDTVIQQNLVIATHLNGLEGQVVEIRLNQRVIGRTTGIEYILPVGYRVLWVDGTRSTQSPHELRLKRPPSKDEFTAGEWELCPWSPYRVGETSV
jgi:hypothetical protein